jgi:hypothetical protein
VVGGEQPHHPTADDHQVLGHPALHPRSSPRAWRGRFPRLNRFTEPFQ